MNRYCGYATKKDAIEHGIDISEVVRCPECERWFGEWELIEREDEDDGDNGVSFCERCI